MPRYLLDTNICIYVRQGNLARVTARFSALQPGEAAMSVISYGELRHGVEKSRSRERALDILEALTMVIPVLPLEGEAGRHYGRISALLSVRGEVIGNNDMWIAAHAQAAGLVLVTNNEREFRRVPGLVVENWAAA